jgi:hypothetical protein
MSGLLENTIWDVPSDWNIKEDYLNESAGNKIADGKNILAVVSGVAFVPDGVSRNERFYPKKFWESILSKVDVMEKIVSRMMLGCIGHNDRAVNEEDIQDGKVSHIVNKLWIDEEGKGMGEFLILGTPAGRNLYVLMKAGCKIKTSSRASGDFKANETFNGMPIVDEASYYLETFDFVINPGFLETNPTLKENVNKIKQEMENREMEYGQKLFEELDKNRVELSEKIIARERDNALLESKNVTLNEEVTKLSEKVNELTEALEEAKKSAPEIVSLTEKLQASEKELAEYKDASENLTAEELKETINESSILLEEYTKLGKINEVKTKIKTYEDYLEVLENVSPSEVAATLSVVEETLEEISELGTLSEIKEIIARAESFVNNEAKEKLEDLAIRISKEYKFPVENAKSLLEKVGEKQTVAILKANFEATKTIIKEEKKPTAKKEEGVNISENISESDRKPVVSSFFKSMRTNFK